MAPAIHAEVNNCEKWRNGAGGGLLALHHVVQLAHAGSEHRHLAGDTPRDGGEDDQRCGQHARLFCANWPKTTNEAAVHCAL